MIKKVSTLAVAAVIVTMLPALAACSTRAGSDQIILYYKNGAGDNKRFVECIQPGKSGSYPVDDQIFALPTSLRTWNVRPSGGDSKDPIKSGSKPVGTQPGPEVIIYTSTDFYLNTDCSGGSSSPIVQFWEKTGRRYGISQDGENGFDEKAWKAMLVATLVTAEEKTIREQTRLWTADELDANLGGAWTQLEKNLATAFANELRIKLGGDFFCGSGYQRGQTVSWTEPTLGADGTMTETSKSGPCPPVRISISDINFADSGIAEARNRVYRAQQEAEAELIKARAEVAKAQLLDQAARNSAYVRLREIEAQLEAAKACAANPNCTIVVGADGVIVN